LNDGHQDNSGLRAGEFKGEAGRASFVFSIFGYLLGGIGETGPESWRCTVIGQEARAQVATGEIQFGYCEENLL